MWGKLKHMSVWLVYNRSRYFFSRKPLSSYSIYFAILKLSFAPFQRMHVRQETWMVIYSIYSPWSCYERGVGHLQGAGYGSVKKIIKLPISPRCRTRPSCAPNKKIGCCVFFQAMTSCPLYPRQVIEKENSKKKKNTKLLGAVLPDKSE